MSLQFKFGGDAMEDLFDNIGLCIEIALDATMLAGLIVFCIGIFLSAIKCVDIFFKFLFE